MKKFLFPSIIVLILVAFVGFIIFLAKSQPADPKLAMTSRELVQQCTTDMATKYHIHAHLTVYIEGVSMQIPGGIGIDSADCMHSIHTHEANGVIHIESPVEKSFTLGDFFFIWKQGFDKAHFLDKSVDSTHGLKMYVNGKESSAYDQLLLEDHQDIVLDYYSLDKGPTPLPAAFDWSTEE